MNIYFVNKKSKTKGPFDITDAHQNHIIKIGDVCIRDTDNGMFFLFVTSNTNRWESCKYISKIIHHETRLTGNTLLFSFDGINKRTGNIEYLRWMSNIYTSDLIRKFFTNAIDILTYKCDYWNIELFVKIHSITPLTPYKENKHRITEKSITSNHPTPLFLSYLDSEIISIFHSMTEKGLSLRNTYEFIRNKYPKEFQTAMKSFLEENPKSTIYDN
ncbi:MAG: hypothetical protein IIX06_00935 [Bacteroidales bacterium]|nr:hypothetical protein [Bacteroidales bacterium]